MCPVVDSDDRNRLEAIPHQSAVAEASRCSFAAAYSASPSFHSRLGCFRRALLVGNGENKVIQHTKMRLRRLRNSLVRYDG